MKRPHLQIPKRPASGTGAVARSRKDAAIQLVRLEFDASRLAQAAKQAELRAATHRAEALQLEARRRTLLSILKE